MIRFDRKILTNFLMLICTIFDRFFLSINLWFSFRHSFWLIRFLWMLIVIIYFLHIPTHSLQLYLLDLKSIHFQFYRFFILDTPFLYKVGAYFIAWPTNLFPRFDFLTFQFFSFYQIFYTFDEVFFQIYAVFFLSIISIVSSRTFYVLNLSTKGFLRSANFFFSV